MITPAFGLVRVIVNSDALPLLIVLGVNDLATVSGTDDVTVAVADPGFEATDGPGVPLGTPVTTSVPVAAAVLVVGVATLALLQTKVAVAPAASVNDPAALTHEGATASVKVTLRASSVAEVLVTLTRQDAVDPDSKLVLGTQLVDVAVQFAGDGSVQTSLVSVIVPGLAHDASRM